MNAKVLTAFYVIALTYLFIVSTTPSSSLPSETTSLHAPIKLNTRSKFSRLFYEQFAPDWKKKGAVMAPDIPLYFLPNETGCALVLLHIKDLVVIRDDGRKMAVDETGINGDGSLIHIYGFNTITRKFDLLLKKRVFSFDGTFSKPETECPDIHVTLSSYVKTTYKYSSSRIRYILSWREGAL